MDPLNFSPYLRLIQKTGSTRHTGGFLATDTLLRRVSLKKSSRLLDVGCGAGHTCAHIAKHYDCSVAGVDISSEALERARAFYRSEPFFNRMVFEVADANNLPFSDGFFDVVLCESVLFFIGDKEDALAEMDRVVKPGGFLAINELCISGNKGLQKIKDYFLRPEFGGFITIANRMIEFFENDGWTILVQDEQPFHLLGQIKSDLTQLMSSKGVLQLLEMFYQTLVSEEARSDLLQMLKFTIDIPKGTLGHLNTLLFLAQKKGP